MFQKLPNGIYIVQVPVYKNNPLGKVTSGLTPALFAAAAAVNMNTVQGRVVAAVVEAAEVEVAVVVVVVLVVVVRCSSSTTVVRNNKNIDDF